MKPRKRAGHRRNAAECEIDDASAEATALRAVRLDARKTALAAVSMLRIIQRLQNKEQESGGTPDPHLRTTVAAALAALEPWEKATTHA